MQDILAVAPVDRCGFSDGPSTPLVKSTLQKTCPTPTIKMANKSVYNYGRNVHIEYLHGVTLCDVTAF
jgi:hypothetical protein